VGTTVAPAYAYADTDASSGSLADFSRVDGGGFSTVGNRPSATTGEAPAAVTSGDTEPTDEPNATGSVKIAAGGERETGEALGEGAEGDSSIADQEVDTETLALPSGDDKSGVTAQSISI